MTGSWTHFSVDRRGPGYCRVTFDRPPINTITATTVAELAELVSLIERDPDLNVVVFDSANPDFYLAHYDVENDPGKTAAAAGRSKEHRHSSGLQPLPIAQHHTEQHDPRDQHQ